MSKSNPSYEAERKENNKFSRNPDASRLSKSGSGSDTKGRPEAEKTNLNQTQIQEGPKGGTPKADKMPRTHQ